MLIVMGTRGKSQKELDLIGSVTAEVLDSTKFPVFAVPESVPFTMIDEVNNIAFLRTSINKIDSDRYIYEVIRFV